MTDWNEHSHLSIFASEHTDLRPAFVTTPGKITPSVIPEPIWRATPRLKTSGIARALHDHILPQVALALRAIPATSAPLAQARPGASFDCRHFAALALGRDENAAIAHAESLTARGTSTELIFLNLLAPSARLLGEMWQADTIDFADVTLAVSRMQRILRKLGEEFGPQRRATGGAVLLTTSSGEQHGFGMAMVAEFFRHDGWDVCCGPFPARLELLAAVAERWFDIVGISVGSDRRLDELKRDIDGIRGQSRNRNVCIMAGGPMIVSRPELARWLGVDASSIDGSAAPHIARRLLYVKAPV